MSALSLTYTITNGTTEDATQVQQNYTDIVNYVNANVIRTDGVNAMTAALSTNNADPTLAAHAVRKGYHDGAYVLATGGTSQTFTANTWITLIYSTKVLDSINGGGTNGATNYNLGTGIFTAPVAGVYQVSFSYTLPAGNTNFWATRVFANSVQYEGAAFVPNSISNVNAPVMNQSIAVYLAAGQTALPQLLQSTTTGAAISTGVYLSIAWLHG